MYNLLSLIIGFFYIALGVFIIVYKFFVVQLEGFTPYVLGGLIIAYGIFRIIRAIFKLRQKNED